MTPTNVLLDRLQALLAQDATTLAPAVLAVHVHLAKASFVPSQTLVVGSFTEADFTGYAVLSAGLGAQQTYVDPVTGRRIVQLLEPAGGWNWKATGAALLPQTMFGLYVTDNANAVLYGSQLLATAIVLAAINDGLNLAQVQFAMPATAIQ